MPNNATSRTKNNAVAAVLGVYPDDLPQALARLRWRPDGSVRMTYRALADLLTEAGEYTTEWWPWKYCRELERHGFRPGQRQKGSQPDGSGPVPPPPAPGERAA